MYLVLNIRFISSNNHSSCILMILILIFSCKVNLFVLISKSVWFLSELRINAEAMLKFIQFKNEEKTKKRNYMFSNMMHDSVRQNKVTVVNKMSQHEHTVQYHYILNIFFAPVALNSQKQVDGGFSLDKSSQ